MIYQLKPANLTVLRDMLKDGLYQYAKERENWSEVPININGSGWNSIKRYGPTGMWTMNIPSVGNVSFASLAQCITYLFKDNSCYQIEIGSDGAVFTTKQNDTYHGAYVNPKVGPYEVFMDCYNAKLNIYKLCMKYRGLPESQAENYMWF